MRVLVCGGRDFNDRALLYGTLDELRAKADVERIIHGGARGADKLAGEWARDRGVSCDVYEADWQSQWQDGRRKYDASAGHRRNQQMLDEGRPDITIAFPGGSGTADMVRRSKGAGVKTVAIPRQAKVESR